MKKMLSSFMAGLFMLLSCGVNNNMKGYTVENLSDGNRKIVYRYDELDGLARTHEQIGKEFEKSADKKIKIANTIDDASFHVSLICIVAGVLLACNGLVKDTKTTLKKKIIKVASGIGLVAASVVGLFGIQKATESYSGSLRNEQYAIEERVSVIDLTKHEIDRYVANGFGNRAEVTGDFSYSMYVDKNGYVYQVERVGRGVSYTKIPLKTKYKITW